MDLVLLYTTHRDDEPVSIRACFLDDEPVSIRACFFFKIGVLYTSYRDYEGIGLPASRAAVGAWGLSLAEA